MPNRTRTADSSESPTSILLNLRAFRNGCDRVISMEAGSDNRPYTEPDNSTEPPAKPSRVILHITMPAVAVRRIDNLKPDKPDSHGKKNSDPANRIEPSSIVVVDYGVGLRLLTCCR